MFWHTLAGLNILSGHHTGWVARVGSACFLCVQILMLLDFVTKWNDTWVDKEDERYVLLLLLHVICTAP